jgi:hypothetical protein
MGQHHCGRLNSNRGRSTDLDLGKCDGDEDGPLHSLPLPLVLRDVHGGGLPPFPDTAPESSGVCGPLQVEATRLQQDCEAGKLQLRRQYLRFSGFTNLPFPSLFLCLMRALATASGWSSQPQTTDQGSVGGGRIWPSGATTWLPRACMARRGSGWAASLAGCWPRPRPWTLCCWPGSCLTPKQHPSCWRGCVGSSTSVF